MICPNCKTKITEKQKACSKCGLKLKLSKKTQDRWIATVTPKYRIAYEIIPTIQEILIIILTCVVGDMVCDFFSWKKRYILYIMIIFCMIYLFKILIRFYHSSKIKYYIYEDRIVLEDNFLKHRQYELNYENVIDIEYRQTLLEKLFHIGTLRIYADRSICKGLALHKIANGEILYKNMKNIIKDSK